MIILFKLLKEGILFALMALWANKLRTFLSLLGITIGIFAIVSVFTIVDSWEYKLRQSVSSLGSEVIYIQKWPWSFGGNYPWWKYLSRPKPNYKEFQFVSKNSKLAESVCFMAGSGGKTIKHGSNNLEGIQVLGVSHDYDKTRNFDLEQGRYFSYNESYKGSRVAIIGHTIAQELFYNQNPIGKEIKIFGFTTKVIGVFKKEGNSVSFNSADELVIVPMNFFRTKISLNKVDPFIIVKGRPEVPIEELKAELKGMMRGFRKLKPKQDDSFALNQISIIDKFFDMIFTSMSIVSWIIGLFSLLVGCFGIANIMFVSVNERINIIGIQKALGAKNYFILLQFLVESIILCIIGGLLGLFIILIGIAFVNFNFSENLGFNLFLSFENFTIAIGVSTVIGILAGIVPAFRASRMDPVEAIRA